MIYQYQSHTGKPIFVEVLYKYISITGNVLCKVITIDTKEELLVSEKRLKPIN